MLVLEEGVEPALARPGEDSVAARPVPACRRCLFGPPDTADARQFLEQELRAEYQRQRRRWNFDFEREQPLPGRYQWERVHQERPTSGAGQTAEEQAQSRLAPALEHDQLPRTEHASSSSIECRTRQEDVKSGASDFQASSEDIQNRPEDPRTHPEDPQTSSEDLRNRLQDVATLAVVPESPNRSLRQQMITDCLRTRRRRRPESPDAGRQLGDAPRAKSRSTGDRPAPQTESAAAAVSGAVDGAAAFPENGPLDC